MLLDKKERLEELKKKMGEVKGFEIDKIEEILVNDPYGYHKYKVGI